LLITPIHSTLPVSAPFFSHAIYHSVLKFGAPGSAETIAFPLKQAVWFIKFLGRSYCVFVRGGLPFSYSFKYENRAVICFGIEERFYVWIRRLICCSTGTLFLCDKCIQLRTVGWLNLCKDVQCTLFVRWRLSWAEGKHFRYRFNYDEQKSVLTITHWTNTREPCVNYNTPN